MNAGKSTYSQLRKSNSALVWMVLIAVMIGVLIGLSSKPAHAQNATCRALESQLARVETGRGGGNSREFQRYDRAVRDQQVQIRKTEIAAQKNGCQARNSNRCQRINNSLGKMYANLNALQRVRDQLAPRGGSTAERTRIIRALRQNGCGAEQPRTASIEPKVDKRRTLLEQIFGSKTYTTDGAYEEDPDSRARVRGSGTFRTLCVRTCDGYYFPISFSTSKNRFESDLAQCEQICPGTETALFYHPMPGGDAESSISYRTGEPYSKLTNAFSYRKKVDSQCSCRFAGAETGFQELAGSEKPKLEEKAVSESKPTVGIPTFRRDIALSEDSLISIEGDMTAEKLAAIADGENGQDNNGNRNIRIVGPAFFPVQ